MRIALASSNPGKLAEFTRLLAPLGFELLPQGALGVSGAVEDGDSFEANALLKARHLCTRTGLPTLADDSGLEVDALGGAPGILSAHYAGAGASAEDNNGKLLAELAGVPPDRRGARFRCVIAYLESSEDPAPLVVQGCWQGRIGAECIGSGGFGYDPCFLPAEYDGRSAAQLSAAHKDRLSHRGQALRMLLAALKARSGGEPG